MNEVMKARDMKKIALLPIVVVLCTIAPSGQVAKPAAQATFAPDRLARIDRALQE